jgi:tetratricopeptide (TPR) repeat protein
MGERDFTEIARLSERYNKDPQSRIFVQLADAYRKNNMIEEAFEVLQKGLEHHPDYPLAHLIMGKCRFDKRMFAQAKESFQKTLEFDPQNVVALRMLAQTCEITNDEAGQIAAYKGLLTIDPFDDQARDKLTQLEAKHKKEPMFTFAMAEEYETQGDLDKALEIFKHLQSTDPSDLTVQKRIKALEDTIAEEKKTIEAKKIESMQVETVFKPEQIEEKLQEVQKPKPEIPPAPKIPEKPKPEIREEVLPLEDFLAESKEGPAVSAVTTGPPGQGAETKDKDIIDEKLDLLEPFKPEEPADKVEKLDILEPVEVPDIPPDSEPEKPPVQEKPAPEPSPAPKMPETPKPEVREPAAEPAPVTAPVQPPEPEKQDIKTSPPPEAPKDEVIILQPPEEKIPEPTIEETPIQPPEKTHVPPEPAPSPEATPIPAPDLTPTAPVEPKPAATQPAPGRETPSPTPEKAKEEPKPKEEDFQSFQDWLSGLVK